MGTKGSTNARPSKGLSTTKMCYCGAQSVSGLKAGIGLCQLHFNTKMFGETWAKWVHGTARCAECHRVLDACQGIFRTVPRCHDCDEKRYNTL